MNIWVYIDSSDLSTSWEVVNEGKILGAQALGTTTALVLGYGIKSLAEMAFQYGADNALIVDDISLAQFRAEIYANNFRSIFSSEVTPDLILFPNTIQGRDLAAMIAIDQGTGVIVDAIKLEVDGDRILVTRPIYVGKILSEEVCSGKPQIITLRSRSFRRPEQISERTGKRLTIVAPIPVDLLTEIEDCTIMQRGVSLKNAEVIIAGGMGVECNPSSQPPSELNKEEMRLWRSKQAEKGFSLIGELADVLGGAVGASRDAVESEYADYGQQIGFTGKTVTPKIYIACGISGSVHHLAGMRTSKMIIAINSDPRAPIFKVAHYGVIGDLFKIVPALTTVLREKKNDHG